MKTFPEVVKGYELEEAEFSVIVPTLVDVTNLVTNPSVELNTTGYSAMAGAIAKSDTNSAFGVYSLKCTPTNALNDGCYYGTFTINNGVQAFGSLYFAGGDPGQKYMIYFADTVGGRKGGYTTFKATGRIQRIMVSFTAPETTLYRLYCVKSNHASTTPFYIDALQVETGAYTTYIDGDRKGFLSGRMDYYWTGSPHASTSVRIGESRHGGEEKNLKDLGFSLLSMVGLGLSGYANAYTPMAIGGETFDGTYKNGRNFTLIGALTDKTYKSLRKTTDAIISILSPDFVSPEQPLILRYREKSSLSTDLAQEIPCLFEGGLEGTWDNYYQERVSLKFHTYFPSLSKREIEEGYVLPSEKYIPNTGILLYRRADGEYIPSGFDNTHSGGLTSIFWNGNIYVSAIGPVYGTATPTCYIYKIDPSTMVKTLIGTTNDSAVCFAVYGDYLYMGGGFTTINGAAIKRLAKYDGSAWSEVAGGINVASSRILNMTFSTDGKLYIIGWGMSNFPSAGNYGVFYMYNNSFYAMNQGLTVSGPIGNIAIGKDGKVWFAGWITQIKNGTVAIQGVTYWNGTAFVDIQGVLVNKYPYGISCSSDGTIYIIGDFTSNEATTVTLPYIAKWTGADWAAVNPGLNKAFAGTHVGNDAYAGKDGIYFAFTFDRAVASLTERYSSGSYLFNGSTLVPADYAMDLGATGTETPYGTWTLEESYLLLKALYITPEASVHNLRTMAITSLTNTGNINTYPKFKFVGPGMLRSIKNFTTGKYIWFFKELVVGETCELSLDPYNMYFTSNLQGNILSSVLAGSSLIDFFLKPGANSIGVFISGTTDPDTLVTITYPTVFGSLP
jgi:hypothetical protein